MPDMREHGCKVEKTKHSKNLSHEKDIETIKKALQGDWFAYEELYVSSFRKALGVAKVYNADKLLTDDDVVCIANEAFGRCVLKLETYTAVGSFSSWLCGFVKNVVREERRKKIRAFEKQNRYQESRAIDFISISPERYVVAKEQRICAWNAYCSLDDFHRILISWNILKETSEEKVLRVTKLTKTEADIQAARALYIMRKRFFEIYGFIRR